MKTTNANGGSFGLEEGERMRRRRGFGRGISVLGRAKRREEYCRKYCSKGIHHWCPVFGKEYCWSRKKVECEYCTKEKQYNSLTNDQR